MSIQQIRGRMVDAAMSGTLVSYGELMDLGGLNRDNAADRAKLGSILADINDGEIAAGRPPLSSVAVNKESSYPSRGYFDYVNANNLRQPGENDITVYARLLKDCYACPAW
jgi:hypothetical protein